MLVSLIIPCFNEREGLAPLLRELEKLPRILAPDHFPEVILVDDGSTDGTGRGLFALADALWFPVRVLSLDCNRGIGAAIREGASLAAGEVVATCDADLAYPLEDLRRLVDCIANGADVSTASPWTRGGGQSGLPFHRLALSRLASAMYRIRFGRGAGGLGTFTCGFRAYRASILETVLPVRPGFAATAEMLVRAVRNRLAIAEVPSALRVRTTGVSKMKIGRTLRGHLGLLLGGP